MRWGIIGTANIAVLRFLPAVREAGHEAAAVAGRDASRVRRWARENGVARAVVGYEGLIAGQGVDALYIPLPNTMHAEWTIRALRAGTPVLCEKPLTASAAEAERVLAVARETGTPLWEAFVFPFHDQMERARGLLGDGVIGELREIQSDYHFPLTGREGNIRLSPGLAGGALTDVGCYPVRLALGLFAAAHTSAWAAAEWDPAGVDVEFWGSLAFPGGRRLLLSCGFNRADDTFTRLLGTGGQISMTNPFHPTAADRAQVHVPGREPVSYPATGGDRHSFTAMIRHIGAVVRGAEAPRFTADATALASARALDDLAAAAAGSRNPGGHAHGSAGQVSR